MGVLTTDKVKSREIESHLRTEKKTEGSRILLLYMQIKITYCNTGCLYYKTINKIKMHFKNK